MHIPSLDAKSESSSSPDIWGLGDFVLDRLRLLEGETDAVPRFPGGSEPTFKMLQVTRLVPVLKQGLPKLPRRVRVAHALGHPLCASVKHTQELKETEDFTGRSHHASGASATHSFQARWLPDPALVCMELARPEGL